MAVATDAPPLRPPTLAEMTNKSTSTWQEDVQTLFHCAKDRFPDVVWDVVDEDAMYDPINERVLNHKGTTSLQILKLLPVILINNTPHTQALVSAVLLRPHPRESDKSLLSSTSQIRIQVEQTRLDILRMIRRCWVSIRQEGGFDNMETWVTAEISDGTGLSWSL